MENAARFTAIKKLLGSSAHIEAAKGTPQENHTYCSKCGDFWEHGVLPTKGKRTDLDTVVESINAGANLATVALEHPVQFVKFHRGLKALISTKFKPRDPSVPPTILWFSGNTGTGKSRMAWDLSANRSSYWKMSGNKWFDGYEQQMLCVWDDFREDQVDFGYLLRLLDRFPMRVESKGDSVEFNSSLIVITTPFAVEQSFLRSDEDRQQIIRRVTRSIPFPISETDRVFLDSFLTASVE